LWTGYISTTIAAKEALARMPVEAGECVLDLGCGSGYAGRALADTADARVVGLDGSPEMAHNAASYTDDAAVQYLVSDFGALPFRADSFDHVWSMDAYPSRALGHCSGKPIQPSSAFNTTIQRSP
jgi:ubiquinone/menaquinone biosynthesis C-methylase UbiE